MKRLLTLFAILLISVFAFAQNPKLSYQAVVRDGQNKLVVEQPVTVTVNVLNSSNTSQFEQTLNATTNRNGLMSLEIGDETTAWNNVNWMGAKIRTAVVLSDGTQWVDTANVNAVPYALQAGGTPGVVIPQSDWAETDNAKSTFILNKPSISDTVNDMLTNGNYVTTTMLDGRHYLTSDSAVIANMQEDIADLAAHTTKAALRDSVAGQIHDSIAMITGGIITEVGNHTHTNKALLDTYSQTNDNLTDAVAKKHTHANADILNAIEAPYSDADSVKLDGIQAGAEVNVNADWNATSGDALILNKPNIPTTVAELTDAANYVTTGTDQTISGDKNFTGSVTVPSGFTLGTTTAESCNNTAVNACDLLTVFDSIQRQFAKMQAQINALRDTLKNLRQDTDVTTTYNCGDSISDHQGNKYSTVQIGTQCWMAENMRCTTSPSTGSYLVNSTAGSYTFSGKMAKWYENDSTNYAQNGLLYNWNAAVDTFNTANSELYVSTSNTGAPSVSFSGTRRGICPEGWHIPSDTEFDTLISNLSSSSASFPVTYVGICNSGTFSELGDSAYCWSSTQVASTNARDRSWSNGSTAVGRNASSKQKCFSVRCIKD